MKRSIPSLFLVTIIGLMFASCSIGSQMITLPNGVSIDADTKERLEALEPEFNSQIAAKTILGKSIDAADEDPIPVQAAREILVREFGEVGLDYIIEGEYGNETVSLSDEAPAKYLTVIGDDSAYVYYMEGYAKYVSLPWGSYNWSTTKVTRRVKTTGEYSASYPGCAIIVARISDSKTPSPGNSKTNYLSESVSADGNIKYGFFPTHPASPVTVHEAYDGVLAGGGKTITLYWQ